jgi:hypothetical protein
LRWDKRVVDQLCAALSDPGQKFEAVVGVEP